jgi:hypothetical protein
MIKGSGSVPPTNGSGSGRPKNLRIRIKLRIQNTCSYEFLHNERYRYSDVYSIWIENFVKNPKCFMKSTHKRQVGLKITNFDPENSSSSFRLFSLVPKNCPEQRSSVPDYCGWLLNAVQGLHLCCCLCRAAKTSYERPGCKFTHFCEVITSDQRNIT